MWHFQRVLVAVELHEGLELGQAEVEVLEFLDEMNKQPAGLRALENGLHYFNK